ncbi:unnamed protein product [Prorocentrum cordatum]|uniref:Uncharacterized protein n=1 Tax=Prorocentrum cordatum TaxID=2364126 RepID=A0ABN9PV22_9DINO|nr:unnamed protein product [Polarella glacialis]
MEDKNAAEGKQARLPAVFEDVAETAGFLDGGAACAEAQPPPTQVVEQEGTVEVVDEHSDRETDVCVRREHRRHGHKLAARALGPWYGDGGFGSLDAWRSCGGRRGGIGDLAGVSQEGPIQFLR